MFYELQTLISDEGGAIVPIFANSVYAMADKVQHEPAVAGNWELDGGRASSAGGSRDPPSGAGRNPMTIVLEVDRPLLLDGGTGRELLKRGVPILTEIWSATALYLAPEIVQVGSCRLHSRRRGHHHHQHLRHRARAPGARGDRGSLWRAEPRRG